MIKIIPTPPSTHWVSELERKKDKFNLSLFIRSIRQSAHEPDKIIKLCELAEKEGRGG